MMNDEEVEALLGSVPKPQLIAGHHRLDLKAKLLQLARNRSAGMKTSKWKWAVAASLATLVVAGVGWAAQKMYFGPFVVEHWEAPVQTVVNPDGRVARPEALRRAWLMSRRTETTPIEDSGTCHPPRCRRFS
jgi:hypothetical protein